MRANFGTMRAWHFAFKSGHEPLGSEGGGEGVTHEFAKAAICFLPSFLPSFHRIPGSKVEFAVAS
jgi:hypothetical protein